LDPGKNKQTKKQTKNKTKQQNKKKKEKRNRSKKKKEKRKEGRLHLHTIHISEIARAWRNVVSQIASSKWQHSLVEMAFSPKSMNKNRCPDPLSPSLHPSLPPPPPLSLSKQSVVEKLEKPFEFYTQLMK